MLSCNRPSAKQQRGSLIRNSEFNTGLAECGIRLKIEVVCGITKIFETGCGMKFQRRDRDKLHFEGGIRDKTATCRIE